MEVENLATKYRFALVECIVVLCNSVQFNKGRAVAKGCAGGWISDTKLYTYEINLMDVVSTNNFFFTTSVH